jgi:hypothetical protein
LPPLELGENRGYHHSHEVEGEKSDDGRKIEPAERRNETPEKPYIRIASVI